MAVLSFKQTKIYIKAFEVSMEIFEITKSFPKEERYALIDQMRRSSRSVCANMAEAYRKKRYPAHFISKLSDCDMENSETGVWLDFALACKYIEKNVHEQLTAKNEEIGRMLNHMINNPEKY